MSLSCIFAKILQMILMKIPLPTSKSMYNYSFNIVDNCNNKWISMSIHSKNLQTNTSSRLVDNVTVYYLRNIKSQIEPVLNYWDREPFCCCRYYICHNNGKSFIFSIEFTFPSNLRILPALQQHAS